MIDLGEGEKINWIPGTPMGITIRDIHYVAAHAHEGIVEIILCVMGKITISYCFEEFTLEAGEFILVDKDAHLIYGKEQGRCVSFYIDLSFYKKKYPYIDTVFFVCEGTKESKVPYNTYHHKYLKAMLLSLLTYIVENPIKTPEYTKKINKATTNIINLLMDKFDIIFWYNPDLDIKEDAILRYRLMMKYIISRQTEKVDISDLAREFQLSKVYVSEFLSSVSLGFRKMLSFNRACSAEKLLINTQMSVLDISETCGFSDPKYFYETFELWYKCTPHQFRKKYLSESNKQNIETYLSISDIADSLEQMRKEHFIEWFM